MQLNNMVGSLLNSDQDNYNDFKIPKSYRPKSKQRPQYRPKKKSKLQLPKISPQKNSQTMLKQLKSQAAEIIEEKWTAFISTYPLLEIMKSQIKSLLNDDIGKLVENTILEMNNKNTTNNADEQTANLQAEKIHKLEISAQENVTKLNLIEKQNARLVAENDKLKSALHKVELTCETAEEIQSSSSIVLTGTAIDIPQGSSLPQTVDQLNSSIYQHYSIRIPKSVVKTCKPIYKHNSQVSNRVVLQFINQYEKERCLNEINKRKNPNLKGLRPLIPPRGSLFVEEFLSRKQAGLQYQLRKLKRIYREKIVSIFSHNGVSVVQLRNQSNVYIHSDEDILHLQNHLVRLQPTTRRAAGV